MNIFPDGIKLGMLYLTAAVLWILLAVTPMAALDGGRALSQYVHDSWGADKGFTGGTVFAIAKSADGYLWLGTEHGLVRFDGFEFTAVPAPLPGRPPIGAVRGLVEDASGNLWVRLDGPRLLRYRSGVFEDAVAKFGLSDATFTAMSQDSQGALLLWGPKNRTLRFTNGHFERIVPSDTIGGIVISVTDAAGGALWLGSRDAGLYRSQNGSISQILPEQSIHSVNALATSGDGRVWIGSENGLRVWEHGSVMDLHLPMPLRTSPVFVLTKDRHQNLWVGTDSGLYRIDMQRGVVSGLLKSTVGTQVTAIYLDPEGEIWFACAGGLQRLRDGMFTSFPLKSHQVNENGGAIFVDNAERTWFAPVTGGLFCLENGVIRRFPVPGLGNEVIYSISGGNGELWLGRQEGGLTRITLHGGEWTARTFTHEDGLAQNSVYTVDRTRDGTVWAGTVSGGVSVLQHGRFTTYTVDNGLQSNAIFSSIEASDGTMWFASPSGLVSFARNKWTTYSADSREPQPNIRTVFEDSDHILWIGTSHGLARFDHGYVRMLQGMPQVLTEEVLGISQDAQGYLWIATSQHLLQVYRTHLLSGALSEDDVLSYGADDGLLETQGVRRDRSLVRDSHGRIWVSLSQSFAVADIQAAADYRWPATVRIDSVSPREGMYANSPFKLPPQTQTVTFRYSSTNMSMPQRTHFRYRLEGSDQTWNNATLLRQVIYTHLSPGHYIFRIMASNGLGAWNGPETDLTFDISPAFWQTWYFRTLCVLATAIAIILLYRIRLFQHTDQLNRRFQDRLAERTRIAQDLHDTLLQGVMSASMQLDLAQDHLDESSPAKPILGRVLQMMRQVTEEGREALRGLRTTDSSMSFEAAFAHVAEEIDTNQGSAYSFQILGEPRQLRPTLRDEVYSIGREALRNAFMHANATKIDLTIEYCQRGLRLSVQDDGSGIEPGILKHGRKGRWGLAGMRERSEAIGSALKISSRLPGGTEVQLMVPAQIAFAKSSQRHTWRFWKKASRYAEIDEREQPPR
ncbi:MAG: hypothetical protein HIU93_11805 [Acidobacteria bacterium]|nr:hypothetical protein [Acidobacteriota bacterium]